MNSAFFVRPDGRHFDCSELPLRIVGILTPESGEIQAVAAGCAVIALFENRSWQYILVNGGYLITAFVLMGAILGAWR